jgi:hypothetical protein
MYTNYKNLSRARRLIMLNSNFALNLTLPSAAGIRPFQLVVDYALSLGGSELSIGASVVSVS